MANIKAVPEQIYNLKSKLSPAKTKCDEACTNVQNVISGLDWQVSSKSGIDEKLAAVQKRLRKQTDLMQSYLGFLGTVGERFEAKDKELRDKSKDIIYQLGQVGAGLSMVNTNPKVDYESSNQLAEINNVAVLFGGAATAVGLAASTSAAALTQTKQTLAVAPTVSAASAAVGAAVGATSATTATTQSAGEIVVTFDPYGGTTPTASQKVKKLMPMYGTLPTPKCNDLKFMGWYTAKTGGVKVISGLMVTNLSNHTLYARWEVKVTFQVLSTAAAASIGAALVQSTYVKYVIKGTTYADAIKSVNEPKISNQRFEGWYKEKESGSQITDKTVCNETKNHNLYPQWSIRVTYSANGGSPAELTDLVRVGKTYNLENVVKAMKLTNGSKVLYRWHENKDGANGTDKNGKEITDKTICNKTAPHTIYAQWALSPTGGTVKINSKYGTRPKPYAPNKGSPDNHTGVDTPLNNGTPLYAIVGGTIVEAKFNGSYGNNLVLKGDDGWYYRYAHMSKFSKTSGTFKAGDQVGLSGNTSSKTAGYHLHFECKKTAGSSNMTNTADPVTRFKVFQIKYAFI